MLGVFCCGWYLIADVWFLRFGFWCFWRFMGGPLPLWWASVDAVPLSAALLYHGCTVWRCIMHYLCLEWDLDFIRAAFFFNIPGIHIGCRAPRFCGLWFGDGSYRFKHGVYAGFRWCGAGDDDDGWWDDDVEDVRRLMDWSVGWLTAWFDWLIDSMIGWLVDWSDDFIGWLIVWLVDWLIDSFIHSFIHSKDELIDWFIDSLIRQLIGGMIWSQVTDFGLSRFKATSVSEKMTGQAGTYHWMAPEVRKKKPRNLCCIFFSSFWAKRVANVHGRLAYTGTLFYFFFLEAG